MPLRISLAILASTAAVLAAAADRATDPEQELEQQRAIFRAVYPEVERGNWGPVIAHEPVLRPYVLWPDLRATWLRANIETADHGEIEAFLDEFGVLKPARELRYRFALHLAREGRLAEYLEIYQAYYQGLNIARLDCLALQAEIAAGREARITARALELWMVGESQADECDPVFENMQQRQLLTSEHVARRFAIAVDARRFTLARYLGKSLEPRYLQEANTWLRAQNQPRDFLAAGSERPDEELVRRQLVYALEQLAYDDPLQAGERWRELRGRFAFSAAHANATTRHIALWSARNRLPEAAELLASLEPAAKDVETGRWLVRARLLQQDWHEVLRGIDALPPDEREQVEWRYWKAVALLEQRVTATADAAFKQLAADRSYYGFLAADAIGAPYALDDLAVDHDQVLESRVSALPPLVRARELYFVGLEGRGRSEWDAAVQLLTSEEQLQAARLADRWGWHSRAIATVASAGRFDDLQIRYPLPWRQDFEAFARAAGIQDSWAYGVARSESLFMRDIRSSAGAVGVMQLLPETGRRTAREIDLPYAGLATLTDSASNIQLGTHYLGKMYARFDDNRVLATAAYNAGPLRVEQWLPATGTLDARIWIENIPYNETRGYVRRVLADDAIFHWRLTGKLRRVSGEMPNITALPAIVMISD